MNNIMRAAIILTAYDHMSRVVAQAAAKSEGVLKGLAEKSQRYTTAGYGLVGYGGAIAAGMVPVIAAYTKLESSSADLASQMTNDAGLVGDKFKDVNALAIKLGNILPGTTADLQGMMIELMRNGQVAQDILDGTGSAAAKLAIVLKMPYAEGAKFAAQLAISTGVASKDMEKFMDVIQRTRNLGVETTEMGYAFGRTGFKQFGLGGLEDSSKFAALFSTIIPITKSGETAGSGMSRLMTAIFDPKKMAAANAQLQQYGLHWDFVDKATGKFKGVENLVGQLGQLGKLSDAQRLSILTSIFGEGEDRKIAAIIAANGVAGYNAAVQKMSAQGSLDQKVSIQAGTVANLWEAAAGTIENAMAAMGQSIGPEIKAIVGLMNRAAAAIQNFASHNPKLFKFIGLVTAGVSAVLMIAGAIKLVNGALLMMNVLAMANPVILIAMAVVAVAALIYVYWGDISAFFVRIWKGIVAYAVQAWSWIKNAFLAGVKFIWMVFSTVNPLGIIIKNWSKIVQFYSWVFTSIKGVFMKVWDWLKGLGAKFWEAGKNIVTSIIDGIMSMIGKAGEAIGNLTKKMRAFLPFSPAKEGAFRDLHRVQIVETIAGALVPAPLVRAIGNVTRAAFGTVSRSPALAPVGAAQGASGGSVVIHYSPTVNLSPGANGGDLLAVLRTHKDELARIINDAIQRGQRVKF